MVNTKIALAFNFIVVVVLAQAQQLDYKGFPQWSWGRQDSTEYYIYSPSDTKAGKKYPVVLFLHGCCGEDYHATLRNAVDPPVRLWHNFGANTQAIPTYIIAPKTKVGWSQHIENLKHVIDSMISKSNADPQRIYISGFSMGAGGTWEFIEKYPDFFAAAIPMGMDFTGKDPTKFKDIPIWTVRGEKDWWARNLGTQMSLIRKLNGGAADSSDYITGINPRLTTFKDLGHGVMWPAVTKLSLLNWTYSKVNDGNKSPTVFFVTPSYKSKFEEDANVSIDINAKDGDGHIAKIEVLMNGKKVTTIQSAPYKTQIKALKGDMHIVANAYDNKGKFSTAATIVKVDIPVSIVTRIIPSVHAGDYSLHQIQATGNGKITYSLSQNSSLPEGLILLQDGIIKGVPSKVGRQVIKIRAEDEDGDAAESNFTFNILPKKPADVIVRNVKTYAGSTLPVTKVRHGEMPHSGDNDEITLSSGIGRYENMTLIQTEPNDSVTADPFYVQFETDEDITVYIAYEKLDNLYTSTIPDWLKGYRKEEGGQIVAQYFYFDVYAKDFPKGMVSIPDAREKENGVNKNYFVMVKRKIN